MARVVISSRAEVEVAQAAQWYERQQPGLGRQFMEALEAKLDLIGKQPLLFAMVRRAPDVRRVMLDRFPWHLWYFLERDEVRVFACLHAKRDPKSAQA